MNNIRSEYQSIGNDLGVQGEINNWQMFVLSPIIAPMIIFWGIMNFIFGTVPDTILGISYDTYDSKEEADRIKYEWSVKYLEQCEVEERAEHEALKRHIFQDFNKPSQK